MGFIPFIALVGGTVGVLRSLKTVAIVLLELMSNHDHITVDRLGDVDYVYPLVGGSCICFVATVGVFKAFKSKYFPEVKTIK